MWTLSEAPSLPADINVLITPYVPVLTIIVGSVLVGVFGVYNRKRGAVETRAPDVNEIWKQQAEQSTELDRERRGRRKMEDYAREVLATFRGYVRRVQNGGSIELSAHEAKTIASDPPTTEVKTTP